MNQLVDNFFSSFAGQFPCSTEDSSDPPLPQDVRFPSPKDQCPLIALTAAKNAQTTTLQRWVSSSSLIHPKGSLKSKRKATVQSSSTAPCPSTQQPDCSSDLIHNTLNHLQHLLTLLESTQHFIVPQNTNALGSNTIPSPYTEAVKFSDASALPEFLSTALSLSDNYFYSSCLSYT